MRIISVIFVLVGLTWIHSCTSEKVIDRVYQTKNVVVVVIDGPRYSESWGQTGRPNVRYMDSVLAPNGCTHSYFYNLGGTWTTHGHTALTTGTYQSIDNTGGEYPQNPGIFQHYLKKHPDEAHLVWLITSKDKLQVLSDCKDLKWKKKYNFLVTISDYGYSNRYADIIINYYYIMNILSLI